MIVFNKRFLANLRPVAAFPIIFIALVFIINNAWFVSLLFESDRSESGRFYVVAVYFLLSFIFLLNTKLLFPISFVLIYGSIFLFYFLLGIINNTFSITSLVLAAVFWVNCFVIYSSIRKISYDDVVRLCQALIAGQFIFLFVVDLLNWIIRGRGLPILFETIAPVSIFGIFLLGFLRKDKQKWGRFYWVIILCFLYFSVSIFADYSLHGGKIQKIQLGLTAFTMLYFCFLYLFRKKLNAGRVFYVLTPLNCLLTIALLCVIYFVDITELLILVQPSSGYLRFAVNTSMLKELSNVSLIFGKGFGSSWNQFYVADLHPDAFMFNYDTMYPHSGLVVLLYEYGLFGIVAFGFCMVKYLLIPNNYIKRLYKGSIASRSFSSWLWLGLLLFFLLQNALYVHGVPSGDLYFQSNSLSYVVFAWLIIKARSRCFGVQPNSQAIISSGASGLLNPKAHAKPR